MNYKITLIYGYKNRDIDRVRRCLTSLKNQTIREFKVILVDYGSDVGMAKKVKQLVLNFPFCKYVYNETTGWVWNRSHALNTGIKLSDTEYVLTTDIDLIYSPIFIKSVLDNISRNIELHSNAYNLPKSFTSWNQLNKKTNNFEERNLTALGLAQGLSTEWHHKINGFDEYYCIWGVEDFDLQQRLASCGLHTKWLQLTDCPVFHQWHPNSMKRNRNFTPKGWHRFMDIYCKKNTNNIKRNITSWGTLVEAKNRPTLVEYQNNRLKSHIIQGVPPLGIQENLQLFLDSNENMIKFVFIDENFHEHKKSKLLKLISFFNGLSNNINLPILLSNDSHYFGLSYTLFDYNDVLLYWLVRNKNRINDYFIKYDENSIILILYKGN